MCCPFHPLILKYKINSRTYDLFIEPLKTILSSILKLLSRGDRPLQMTFEDQLNALIYFHLQEHKSARHLIQDLKENEFAKQALPRRRASAEAVFRKR